MLSQRAVDYAIKAYELQNIEICHLVQGTEHEVRELEMRIGDRGRALKAAGEHMDAHSPSACYSLRMYSALRVICMAAAEIAQNTRLILHSGRVAPRPPSSLKDAAAFVI